MELLVTIRNKDKFNVFKNLVDGVIIGSIFTSGFKMDLNDLKQISNACKAEGKKCYVVVDDFISESDKSELYSYFDFLSGLNPDGIYFHDLALIELAKKYNMLNKMIYDGKTIICNSLETAFYLGTGIDSLVLSRELTLDEIKPIIENNPNMIDMQIFGHIRMSYSKRKFLSNYFHELGSYYDYSDKQTLTLTEEKRDYHMPIIQDESGTKIYSDFIFNVYSEYAYLKKYLKRGIVDTLFIDDNKVLQVLRDLRRINDINVAFLKHSFEMKEPKKYSTGYFYIKTNKTKDGKD